MQKAPLPDPIIDGMPFSALAPMQDVTTLPFMSVISEYGAPDYFFTEYFRVHDHSTLESHILESITENKSGRPVFAQMIGESLEHLKRTVLELKKHPVAGIDLNMGCPAPKVYKKNVGGGLLRSPETIDGILGTLRESIDGLFTVKMRIGFECTQNYATILELINKHDVDLLSVHGRTVKEMYRGDVHYDAIKIAVNSVKCPVLANGNIATAADAKKVLETTGAKGVMIGRGAIRNPWIFKQIREELQDQPLYEPTLAEVYEYIEKLHLAIFGPDCKENHSVARMKKFLNFVGQGVDPEGQFLHKMRRTRTYDELFDVCKHFLLEEGRDEMLFACDPYEGLIARPNCEC
jgi:nifR3 family TIM-barrel protein